MKSIHFGITLYFLLVIDIYPFYINVVINIDRNYTTQVFYHFSLYMYVCMYVCMYSLSNFVWLLFNSYFYLNEGTSFSV